MYNLVFEFFNTLLGITLPESVTTILSFALVSTLFTTFFSIFGVKHEKIWRFATYISIGVIALLSVADSSVFSLAFGGV